MCEDSVSTKFVIRLEQRRDGVGVAALGGDVGALEAGRTGADHPLAGAEGILVDRGLRQRCHEVVRKITYIELNVNQEFMSRFSGSRFIPHTDHALFPSVPFFSET